MVQPTTTKSFTIVSILHLVFTILSIVVLSYKVYHLESELSSFRAELSTHLRSDGLTEKPPLSTSGSISEHSRSESRSDRNRRRDHKDSQGNGVSAASLPSKSEESCNNFNKEKYKRRFPLESAKMIYKYTRVILDCSRHSAEDSCLTCKCRSSNVAILLSNLLRLFTV